MRHKKSVLFIVIVFSGLISPCTIFSFPYQPAVPIRIYTEFITPKASVPESAWWIVDPASEKGIKGLSFHRENASSPACSILFSGKNSGPVWNGLEPDQNLINNDDVLILPGYPIPCDILPVAQIQGNSDAKIYEVKRTAGNRTFVDRIEISSITVNLSDAIKNGWLKSKDGYSLAGALRLVRAVNLRTKEIVSQQLWSEGGIWWIYEETPYRRSWNIP